jgi:hypothetical protein
MFANPAGLPPACLALSTRDQYLKVTAALPKTYDFR